MKFHLNSFNGCQLTERTRNSIANDQREITPKISKAELWFLCMTHCGGGGGGGMSGRCERRIEVYVKIQKKNQGVGGRLGHWEGGGGGEGGGGLSGQCERRIEVYVKIQKKKSGGWGGRLGHWEGGGSGWM